MCVGGGGEEIFTFHMWVCILEDFCVVVVNVLSAAYGYLMTNHTLKILLRQFKTQVIKSRVCLIHCQNAKNKPYMYVSMHNSTCFGTYLYFVGTHHSDLVKWNVTEQGNLLYSTGPHGKLTALGQTNAVKKWGEDLEK